ncbi:hypothetical protein B4U80_11601 [Leptotrombidium deliense]|uniref:Uncharacterized protein n=1 Tax=Leptotrombidium deliense TaxID=299467 RepID=A0A443STP7_9ACAR|nr:hypothetical protein B4U80_11601 [Leptotrombidium deliense]
MGKTKVSLKNKSTKRSKKLGKCDKISKKTGRGVKRVRFAAEVEEAEISDAKSLSDVEEFDDLPEDEDLREMEEEMDDDEREFLEKSKRGESYPIVKGESEEEDEESESEDDFDYNASIDELKEKDPEFYEYLLKHDKVTHSYVNKLSESLKEKCDRELILKAVKLFRMAVEGTEASSENTKLYSPEVLSSIIHMCLLDLLPAIHKFLKLPPPTASKKNETKQIDPSKSKNWKKLVSPLKQYLDTVIKVFNIISESSVVVTLLRHCLHLIPFFNCFIPLLKRLLKKAIEFWSEGEEKVRVLAFLIMVRLLKNEDKDMISFVLKKLYFSYIKNCKFTSPQNWPLIIFMRQSLVELYSLNQVVAYNHAFVFIRQCAISLRNAISSKEKDSLKSVVNWQYVHSLLLWVQLLSSLHPSEALKPLIHPLVQVLIGTIRLNPVAKNLPLRFHIVKGLTQLSAGTDTFIPILPFITESLELIDFERKPKIGKGKKINFECILKVSKLQVHDKQFIESAVNKVYELLLEYTSSQSHSIAFPELVFLATVRVRKFLKSCKVSTYCRLLKQAVDKIEENSKFIEEQRRKLNISITDASAISEWEKNILEKKTPLNKFMLYIALNSVAQKSVKANYAKKMVYKENDYILLVCVLILTK